MRRGAPNFKIVRIDDLIHRQLMRGAPCCYAGKHVSAIKIEGKHMSTGCFGDVVAAHIRIGSCAGIGKKPGDNRTIPLCFAHHDIQHQKGELWFHGQYLHEAEMLALRLFELTQELKDGKIVELDRWKVVNKTVFAFTWTINN